MTNVASNFFKFEFLDFGIWILDFGISILESNFPLPQLHLYNLDIKIYYTEND
jgi:hypothetical protein